MTRSIAAAFMISALALPMQFASAQLAGVPAIHGDLSRGLLGDGTGVIIGFVDSGADSLNPVLGGVDSLGRPRLVAQQNFVISEPSNTGSDVFGHGTWVSSVAVANDPLHSGMAPDARYINARVLDSTNRFAGNATVLNGIGYAISQGANVINLSLNYGADIDSGNDPMDMMLDWAASTRGITFTNSAGNISTGLGSQFVRGPATAYNGLTVGRTTATFDQVHFDSAIGPTPDLRDKPDVVAPGSALIMASNQYETSGTIWDPTPRNGTSFAAPHVAGLAAQEIDYGQTHGLSTSPLVVKATIMNSTVKVADKDGSGWKPLASSVAGGVFQATSPLDSNQGTGQVDGVRLYQQYSVGQHGPGTIGTIGWDLHTVSGMAPVDYIIGSPQAAGNLLDVTLDWFRNVTRMDDGDGVIDNLDSFTAAPLSNLNLSVLVDGVAVARSMSAIDNVEYLHFVLPQAGTVTIEVSAASYSDPNNPSELYGLAWNVVPEPAGVVLAAIAGAFAIAAARRCDGAAVV